MNLYNIRDKLRQFAYFLQGLITPRNVIILAAVLIIISGIAIAFSFARAPSPSDTELYAQKRVKVGLVMPTSFAYAGEDGQPTGFERAVADAIIERAYGDRLTIEYVPLTSQNASYAIKQRDVDMALGMFVSNITKTKGTLMTTFYYADDNVIVVPKGVPLELLSDKTIGIMGTEVKTATAKDALERQLTNIKIMNCTSYSDAFTSLKTGSIAALVCARHKIANYLTDDYEIIGTAGQSGYGIMLWTSETDLESIFTSVIKAMRQDGTLELLRQEWGV